MEMFAPIQDEKGATDAARRLKILTLLDERLKAQVVKFDEQPAFERDPMDEVGAQLAAILLITTTTLKPILEIRIAEFAEHLKSTV
jgi:hypothetical protein